MYKVIFISLILAVVFIYQVVSMMHSTNNHNRESSVKPQKSNKLLVDMSLQNLVKCEDALKKIKSKAESILKPYKDHYPDVLFTIGWDYDSFNGTATQGKRIAINGGTFNNSIVGSEGIGLLIAHELGHHYGGKPVHTIKKWSSCEGQADYWGAAEAQRKVWKGKEYQNQMKKGIQQLFDFYKGKKLDASANYKCSQPTALCRKKIWIAAMNNEKIPACAVPKIND